MVSRFLHHTGRYQDGEKGTNDSIVYILPNQLTINPSLIYKSKVFKYNNKKAQKKKTETGIYIKEGGWSVCRKQPLQKLACSMFNRIIHICICE